MSNLSLILLTSAFVLVGCSSTPKTTAAPLANFGLFIDGADFSKIESPTAETEAWASCVASYRFASTKQCNSAERKQGYLELSQAFRIVLAHVVASTSKSKSTASHLLTSVSLVSGKQNEIIAISDKLLAENGEDTLLLTLSNTLGVCDSNAHFASKIIQTKQTTSWDQEQIKYAIKLLSKTR